MQNIFVIIYNYNNIVAERRRKKWFILYTLHLKEYFNVYDDDDDIIIKFIFIVLFTNGEFYIFCTSFAFHIATPMKFAFTSFLYFCFHGIITASAAHHFAAVQAF